MNCNAECIHGKKCIIGPPNHQVHHTSDDCYIFPYPGWNFNPTREPYKFERLEEVE